MATETWYADVDFIAPRPIGDEATDDLLDRLAPYGGALALSRDGKAGGVSVAIEADGAVQASKVAAETAGTVLSAYGPLDVVKIDVRTEAVMEAEISAPSIPELVGYAEIAEMAGVSRQRARQFADIDGFPMAVVETAAGPLRTKASVEAWVETRNTKPGRPRVHA